MDPSPAPSPDIRQPTRIVLAGGGGHAVVVAEAATLLGLEIVGFFDDQPGAALGAAGEQPHAPQLGGLGDFVPSATVPGILGIGHLPVRGKVLASLGGAAAADPARWCSIVHPAAVVSPSARLGIGVFVGPRAVVHTRAQIGDHAIVNSGAIVEHECLIGRNAHIAPGAVVAGRCAVGEGTLIGLGAVLLPGIRLGPRCVVGAGAVVRRDVPEGATVVGVPGRERPVTASS